MSMLATAGIYLVLDVNSPRLNEHLNRYQPWTTYNEEYLKHVFSVVKQFSSYNNTLGFFAGNEIVNDELSAKNSPTYIKAITRDIKMYIEQHSPRFIPVGYSAADDLNYRMPLANYLACSDDSPFESVDFYGVNSYQWCGEQTFYTSGYNTLVDDYSSYAKPVFFSEYGCNEVYPRPFEEVRTLYSTDMIDVFSGGLVYEFTQEPNNYGLVKVLPDGNIRLMEDFVQLKSQFDSLPEINYAYVDKSMRKNAEALKAKSKSQTQNLPQCQESYQNLNISGGIPPSVAEELLYGDVDIAEGKYVELTQNQLESKFKIFSPDGSEYKTASKIIPKMSIMDGSVPTWGHTIPGYKNCTYVSESDLSEWDYDDYEEEENHEAKIPSKLGLMSKISQIFKSFFTFINTKLFD